MNTQIVFTLKDLGMFVLWGLVVAVLVYLLLILIRFYKSFKELMAIVDENRENINKVLDEAPGITKNVNQISDEAAHFMSAFRGTVDNVADTSEAVTGSFKDNNDLVAQITTGFKVLNTIKEGIDRLLGKNKPYTEDFSTKYSNENNTGTNHFE